MPGHELQLPLSLKGNAVQVRGIDRDGESREIEIEHLPARDLAAVLARADWKAAVIEDDGEVVGGVRFDAASRHRVPWTVTEQEKEEPR